MANTVQSPVAAHIYVRILEKVANFGVHEFWTLPRVGEMILLARADADHTLTVREIRHDLRSKFGIRGHSITLICD